MKHIPLPRTTASFKLFFTTLALIGIVSISYFSLYSPVLEIPEEIKGKTIILVSPDDDLNLKIKEAPENSILLVAPSKREENVRITEKANITIKSEGKVTIWAIKGPALVIENSRNCSIVNIHLENEAADDPVVSIYNSDNISLRDNSISGKISGVTVQSSSNKIYLENNHIKCAHKAIYAEKSQNVYAKKNDIVCHAETEHAVSLFSVLQFSLEDNKIKGDKGIFIRDCSAQKDSVSSVFRNDISTALESIEIMNSENISFTANTISSEKKEGIYSERSNYIEIGRTENVANKIKADNDSCVHVSGGKTIKISHNTLHNRSKQNATIEIESGNGIEIIGNEITGKVTTEEGQSRIIDCQGGGVYIKDTRNIVCDKNIIRESEKGFLIEICPDIILKNNKIFNNQGRGIQSENSTLSIENNEISKNIIGVWLIQCNGKITENDINEHKGYGIYLDKSSPQITLNRIKSNEGDGVYCGNNSNPTEISGNQFIRNKGYALKSEKKITFDASKNTLEENIGVYNWK